jgi:hypothetical protein
MKKQGLENLEYNYKTTLAYCTTILILAVKSFIVQAHRVSLKTFSSP